MCIRDGVMNRGRNVDKTQQLPEGDSSTVAGSTSEQSLSASALARRRALFKGLGKGSAVLAASVPIQTLASQTLLTAGGQHQCSVSGMHSGVHSAVTNVAYCGGYSPGWWGQSKLQDGKLCPKRTWPTLPNSWTYETKCKTVFTRSTLRNTDGSRPTLFEIVCPKDGQDSKFSNTDEFHWVCAWLNALSNSFNFPYTGQQVIDFYNNPAMYADALLFFKTYMEQHTS